MLHDKDYIKAIGLAISLEQPFRVLKIMKGKLSWPKRRIICHEERDWGCSFYFGEGAVSLELPFRVPKIVKGILSGLKGSTIDCGEGS